MNVVVLTGSARPNSVGRTIAPLIIEAIKAKQAEVELVDASQLNLPFFNAPIPPSAPDYAPTDENVVAWTQKVSEADAVVMLTPEYNGGPSAIQKNAIDWVYAPWKDKPVVMIGYGWHQPSRVHESLKVALEIIKAKQGKHVQLQFGHELEMDGSVKDNNAATAKIETAITSIMR